VADWTKCNPNPARALPAPKLNIAMNSNLLRVLVLEPLQLLLCLLVVETLTLKLRLKATRLRLQNLYLRFRIRETVKRKGKTLANYVRYRKVFQCVSGDFKEAHNVNGVVRANDASSATRPARTPDCNRSARAGFAAAHG